MYSLKSAWSIPMSVSWNECFQKGFMSNLMRRKCWQFYRWILKTAYYKSLVNFCFSTAYYLCVPVCHSTNDNIKRHCNKPLKKSSFSWNILYIVTLIYLSISLVILGEWNIYWAQFSSPFTPMYIQSNSTELLQIYTRVR